jgi:predicted DCC family thiol-disulfide oxidoreductase YuxK
MDSDKKIVLIDGVCNLCSHVVVFTVQNEAERSIQFASLQSPAGQRLLMQHGLPTSDFKSFVWIENGTAYTKSTGALKYLKQLKKPWRFLYVLIAIPRPIRDFFYDIVARNRYRWFGKSDQCLVPSPELKSRFLDEN